MKERDEARDLHEQHIELRGLEVFRLMMWGLCIPCEWSKSEVWRFVVFRHDDITDQDFATWHD
jgi:hypothetical protein